nr:ARF guanine-nucleotide exchange factor GNL2-like [Ipomoea trifida]
MDGAKAVFTPLAILEKLLPTQSSGDTKFVSRLSIETEYRALADAASEQKFSGGNQIILSRLEFSIGEHFWYATTTQGIHGGGMLRQPDLPKDEAPAAATGLTLSSVFKILKLEIFNHKTPGVREAINSSVAAITSCRLEKIDPISEDAVMMKILQV